MQKSHDEKFGDYTPKTTTEKLAYAMCAADGIHPETEIPGGRGAKYLWETYLVEAIKWVRDREDKDNDPAPVYFPEA